MVSSWTRRIIALEHFHFDAVPGESQCAHQASDAGAGDGDAANVMGHKIAPD